VTRIGWCVEERALRVITGEVGAGKTVAVRAAVASLDTSRFTILYFANPSVGLYDAVVSGLGGVPRSHKTPSFPGPRCPGRRGGRAGQAGGAGVDEAHLLDAEQPEELRRRTLKLAGRANTLFSDDAVALITRSHRALSPGAACPPSARRWTTSSRSSTTSEGGRASSCGS
jgi:hypothetical protein